MIACPVCHAPIHPGRGWPLAPVWTARQWWRRGIGTVTLCGPACLVAWRDAWPVPSDLDACAWVPGPRYLRERYGY